MVAAGLPQPTDTADPISKPVPSGEKTQLGAVTVPLDAVTANLSLDSTWHTDPSSVAVWGFEVSLDGGATWSHWGTATRNGGPATTDNGVLVTVFDMTTDTFAVNPKTQGTVWDLRGKLIRPFLGVLKGDGQAVSPNVTGSINFK